MSRHFLLTTMFSTGDVVPFVRLGARLRSRGHRVTLVTHAPYRAAAEEAELEFGAWDTPDEHREMLADGTLFNDVSGFATIYERYVVPMLERERAVLGEHCGDDTVLVTRCGPAFAARVVAEERGVPLVEVYLGPGHVSPPAVLREFVRPFRPAVAALRARDDAFGAWVTANNAALGLWPDWFAPPQSHWPASLACTGFAAPPSRLGVLDPELARFLGGDGRVVLLAPGTGLFLTRAVVAACIAASRAVGCRLLLVTPFDALVPDALGPDVYRAHSAPYDAVVPRTSLVVHHGGIGTVQDALRGGVPQIALGVGGDRPINAACIERLGVGRYVRPVEWSERVITAAMDALLSDAAVRQACVDTAARLRSDPGDGGVCLLEELPGTPFPEAVARAPAEPLEEKRGVARTASAGLAARLASLSPNQRALLLQRARKREP